MYEEITVLHIKKKKRKIIKTILPVENIKIELLLGFWEENSGCSLGFFFSFVPGWNNALCVPPVCFPEQLCNVLTDFKYIQGKDEIFRHMKFVQILWKLDRHCIGRTLGLVPPQRKSKWCKAQPYSILPGTYQWGKNPVWSLRSSCSKNCFLWRQESRKALRNKVIPARGWISWWVMPEQK